MPIPEKLLEVYADGATKKAWTLLGLEATHTMEDMCKSAWSFAKKSVGTLIFALSGMSWRGLVYQSGVRHVFVKRKCEQKGPKKVSTFSTRFHVVSNVFPKYQMLTF